MGPVKGWLLLVSGMLLLILLPFLLLEDPLSAAILGMLDGGSGRIATALLVILSLAADLLLPVPSSLVSVAAGALLGWAAGTIAVTMGMMASALLGHWLGRKAGPRLLSRLLPERERARLTPLIDRRGAWAVAALRPVPVLAEASSIMAGLAGMPLRRFLPACLFSSVGVAALYAGAGALAARSAVAGKVTTPWPGDAALLPVAFALALALPALAWLVSVTLRRLTG